MVASSRFEGGTAGLVTLASSHSVDDTMQRIQELLQQSGIHIFAKVDHAAGARNVGMDLRPTQLILFGNAAAGTPLMQANQTIGIDLPLKMLVWEDGSGQAWLSYNRPEDLIRRHEIHGYEKIATTLAATLDRIAHTAAAPQIPQATT
jgi:uncharacterized protein (DUF302 family)